MYARRHLVCLVVIPLVAAIARPAHAGAEVVHETLATSRGTRSYSLYVPSAMPSTPMPLLVVFHGSGRDGRSLVEPWKDLAEKEGFVVVGPDARYPEAWRVPDDGPDFVRDLVAAIERRVSIDAHRVYFFGHSSGAVFALTLGVAESRFVAATAVHAGAFRERREFTVLDGADRRTPTAIFVGDRDPFFPAEAVAATKAAFEKKKFPITVTILPNHDHWYDGVAPEVNRAAWAFLAAHRLDDEPTYAAFADPHTATEFNAIAAEINAYAERAGAWLAKVYAADSELASKDLTLERAFAADVARTELDLLGEAAASYRGAQLAAERGTAVKLSDRSRAYLAVVGEANRTKASACAVMRERAEAVLSGAPPVDVANRMNDAAVRVARLTAEARVLDEKAAKLRASGL